MDLIKGFVPVKTDQEKLKAIDSNIENLIKMLRQELEKRKTISSGWADFINSMVKNGLDFFEDDFNAMKNKQTNP